MAPPTPKQYKDVVTDIRELLTQVSNGTLKDQNAVVLIGYALDTLDRPVSTTKD